MNRLNLGTTGVALFGLPKLLQLTETVASFFNAQSSIVDGYLRSAKGSTATLPDVGRAVSFDGITQYMSVADLAGTETVVSSDGTSTPTVSAGRIDFSAGTAANVILSSGHNFYMNEESGSAVTNYGTGAAGVLVNNPLRITDNTIPNKANEGVAEAVKIVGSNCINLDGVDDYVDFGDLSKVDFTSSDDFKIECYVKTPSSWWGSYAVRGIVTKGVPVFSNDGSNGWSLGMSNTGRIYLALDGLNANAIPSTSGTIGTNEVHKISASYTASTQAISYEVDDAQYGENRSAAGNTMASTSFGLWFGTTPTIGRFFPGQLWGVKIWKNGDLVFYSPAAEGLGGDIYDVTEANVSGTVNNAATGAGQSFWSQTQETLFYNLENGFSYSGQKRIPALLDGSADAQGNTITNPAGDWHNDAETELKPILTPSIFAADTQSFWHTSGTVNQISYDDIVANVNNANETMANVATTNQKSDLMLFNPALTGGQLDEVKTYLSHP